LADEYLRRGRDDEAMALPWAQLLDRHDLAAYQLLKRYADRIEAWDAWRPRALAEMRRSPPDGTRLVEVLTWEGESEAAWAEARRLGCARHVLMRLAKQSEDSRPDDALAVYRDEVESILEVTDRRAYEEAVDLLEHMKKLMVRLGRKDEFRAYASEVRAANVRRPRFLKEFDSAGLL
jgi:hypothetical protein